MSRNTIARPTAAAALGIAVGAILIITGVIGVIYTLIWMGDAAPGDNRSLGGVLAIVFCLLGAGIGSSMARNGPRVLRGEPRAAGRLGSLFGLLSGLSGLATVHLLFFPSLHTDNWVPHLLECALVCAVMVTGVVLCEQVKKVN